MFLLKLSGIQNKLSTMKKKNEKLCQDVRGLLQSKYNELGNMTTHEWWVLGKPDLKIRCRRT